MNRASEQNLVALLDKNSQRTGSIAVALELLVRKLMKNTALSASLDTVASLAFREFLK